MGGYTSDGEFSDEVWVTPLNSGEIVEDWDKLSGGLKEPLYAFAAVIYRDWLYILGGWNGDEVTDGVYFSRLESDLINGVYTDTCPLPIRLYRLAAFVLSDRMFVVGGRAHDPEEGITQSCAGIWSAKIDPVNGALGEWEQEDTLPIALESHTTILVEDGDHMGQVYVIGGEEDGQDGQRSARVFLWPLAHLSKGANPSGVVYLSDRITYTITYANNGLRDLSGVFITDPVPLNTCLLAISSRPITEPILWVRNGVTVTVDGITAGSTITWDFGTLPITSSGQVSFVVQVIPPEVAALSGGVRPLAGSSTSVQAVLPDWFAASRMNAPQTAAARPSHADAEMTCASQGLAMGDNSSRHTSTAWPNPMLSRAYRNTSSNLVSVAPPIPVPVTPATHTTWTQTCTLAHLEVLGKGMSDTLTATLTIPHLDSIVGDSMRVQVSLKISSGGEASRIAEVILSTGDSSFRLTSPTSVDDSMAVYELDIPVSEAVTVTVVPIGGVMTRTDGLAAYVWRKASERRSTSGWTDNQMVYRGGSHSIYSRTLSLPPLTEPENVTVQVAGADNDPDGRSVYLEVEAGGITATKVITTPSHSNYLDIHSLVLTNVPAETSEVVVTIESPPDVGDSFGLLGTVAEVACPPAPTVLDVRPDTFCNDVDNEIAVEGSNFVPTPQVQLDDTELLSITFISSNALTAVIPSSMTHGAYFLTVTNLGKGDLSATLTDAITMVLAAFSMDGVTPTVVCNDVATPVEITGSNFVTTPSIYLDATLLGVTFFTSTTIEAIVPGAMESKPYTLTVVNGGFCPRERTLTNAITVAHAAITVTGVQPGWGANDRATLITVTGENLKPTPTLWLGDIELSGVAYLSPTAVTAVVTPGLTPGYYDLTVTNPEPCQRSATIGAAFRVDFSPVIITNVAYFCSDQTGCVPSNPVMNTPYKVYFPIIAKSYTVP